MIEKQHYKPLKEFEEQRLCLEGLAGLHMKRPKSSRTFFDGGLVMRRSWLGVHEEMAWPTEAEEGREATRFAHIVVLC